MAASERLCTVTKTFLKYFLTTVGEIVVQGSVRDPLHFGADLWLMDPDQDQTPDPTPSSESLQKHKTFFS
jgi:hypothetical protein